jgi:regulator of sigma E protease
MLDLLIAILAVIFVLGVAINIHEFGHFIIAKMFGMRVDAYSFFGLGPRIWGFKWGHTDYRISAIPLGAYVKLYGDESNTGLEGADDQSDPVPESELYELRPRWQKFLVMLGGPLMNLLLAMAIPFTMAMIYGVPSNPAPIVGVVKAGGAADTAGIKVGDRIINFEGVENPTWERINNDAMLIPEKAVPIAVERGGERVALNITPTKVTREGNSMGDLDLDVDSGTEPVVVGQIQPGMPAAETDLKTGDWVVSVNGTAVKNRQEMKRTIAESKGEPIKLQINRNGERKEIETHAVAKDNDWLIGIAFDNNLISARQPVGPGTAVSYAFNTNFEIIRLTFKAFGQVGTGERSARDTVSGPIGIVQIIAQMAKTGGFTGLLFLLGLISLNLGVLNLFPIPMLDGGQIMVLGIEKVLSWFHMTLSMAVKEKIQLAGLAVILLLMVFSVFNDISRFFK